MRPASVPANWSQIKCNMVHLSFHQLWFGFLMLIVQGTLNVSHYRAKTHCDGLLQTTQISRLKSIQPLDTVFCTLSTKTCPVFGGGGKSSFTFSSSHYEVSRLQTKAQFINTRHRGLPVPNKGQGNKKDQHVFTLSCFYKVTILKQKAKAYHEVYCSLFLKSMQFSLTI